MLNGSVASFFSSFIDTEDVSEGTTPFTDTEELSEGYVFEVLSKETSSACYKVNDKIIMTKNNYEADYYNGDIGIIRSIDKNKQLHVEIREKEYVLTRDMMEDIRLAYGMTIHKSQGSEFPIVIVVMPMKPKIMLVRNLLYTAITRAKKQCIIINEGTALETAIKTIQAGNRRTRLKTLLEQRGMC